MPVTLEEVVRKIFTFKSVYDWRMDCTNVSHAAELDTNDSLCYRINVVVTWDSGTKENFDSTFFIPKLTRGSLELRGRKKQSVYTALGNAKIRIFSRILSWGNPYSSYQKFEVDCRHNKTLLVMPFNRETYTFGEEISCYASNFFKYWNKWEPEFAFWFDKKDLEEADKNYEMDKANIERINNTLVIDEEPLRKLRFLAKNPNLPNKLTPEVIDSFIYIIENDELLADRPTPMDYRFLDTYEALATSLDENYTGNRSNDIRSHVMFNMSKNGTFRTSRLQAKIDDFFKGKKGDEGEPDEYSNIQDFTDSNALSVAELNDKIYFEEYSKTGYKKQRLNPQYFVGMIDPVFTADSNQVNIKNELSIAASIRDGKLYVKVLDLKFNEVELESYDYLMSGVLSPDNIDYVKKTYFPVNGKYSVYKYGEYIETSDANEFKYLRKEDSILTDSTAMIPFINRTQSMRSMLGAHMLTQAIPVNGSQPMFINTGRGKTLYNETALNVETPEGGTVVAMTDDYMKISKEGQKDVIIKRPDAYNTANGTTNLYAPSVKVGDRVDKGQTVYECNSFKDKDFALGVPLLVAFCSWYAREHEDGMVLRRGAAAKFTHDMLEEVEIPVTSKYQWILGSPSLKDSPDYKQLNGRLDDIGLIKVGEYVKKGDTLFMYEQVVPEYNERARVAKLLDPNSTLTDIKYVEAPFEVTDGTVTSIKFIPTKGAKLKFSNDHVFNTLSAHFDKAENEYLEKEANALGIPVKELKKPAQEFYSSDPMMMGTIKINILYKNYLKSSDKMSNYYGSKGVVSTIIDDDKMLRTEDGRIIDIVISPLSVISRINISQMYVSSLGLISKTLFERLEAFFMTKEGSRDKNEEELLKGCIKDLLYKRPNVTLEQVYKESKPYGFVQIQASAFDKYFTDTLIKDIEKRLGIKDHERLYDPTTGKWIRTPIRIGYQDFLRLHFISEHKMKVTGTGKHQRVIGYGAVRDQGQSIGEQESWSLMSYGDLDLLHKFSHERDDKAAKFSQEMISVGLILNRVDNENPV